MTKNITNTEIVVNWIDNATSEDGYQIWRVLDGGLAAQLGSNLAANTVTYTDADVTNGHTYGYLIRSFQADGAVTHYSSFCSTPTSNLNEGNFMFEGIQFN